MDIGWVHMDASIYMAVYVWMCERASESFVSCRTAMLSYRQL